MEIRRASARDIGAWMELVSSVRDSFPGLETQRGLDDHQATMLDFVRTGEAIGAFERGKCIGALLFSKELSMLCFLAVAPERRRMHVGEQLVAYMLTFLDPTRDVTVTTYRAGVSEGEAARAFYKCLGFAEGRLGEEFGAPVQEFILRR